ncbi:MAG TPA: DUF4339 domain-containing protein [Chthoniobacterales bacterium]|jgi:hypothetical protein
MPEEWIVRVQGREYGPVDADELRAWRQDGRLIRENEIREADNDRWFPAGQLPEVFADDVAPAAAPPLLVRHMTFGQIVAESWRVYRHGFGRFFLIAALVSLPSFILQMAAPFLEMPANGKPSPTLIAAVVIAFLSLMALIIAWPFSLAAMQLLAADLFAGRAPGLRDLLARAKPLWTRMFVLGLIVYGSYFLWTLVPCLLAFSTAAGGSLGGILIALLLLLFALYMVARLFINFLFWQQSAALGSGEMMDALRESKDLARGGTDRPYLQRPLWRGALIASVWLLLILGLNVAIELPALLWRMRGITTVEQALPLLQAMATTNTLDLSTIVTTALSSLVNAVLRGWLAAIFVVLYLDTKKPA